MIYLIMGWYDFHLIIKITDQNMMIMTNQSNDHDDDDGGDEADE